MLDFTAIFSPDERVGQEVVVAYVTAISSADEELYSSPEWMDALAEYHCDL